MGLWKSVKRERPLTKGLAESVMMNGRPRDQIEDIKCPLLNPYTAQSKWAIDFAVSVRSELYRHRLSQRRGRHGYWTEPKAMGQLVRCCDPVSTKARRAGSDAGLA